MKVLNLSSQEAALNDGYNLLFVIDADDLTMATATTAQTITLFTCSIGDDFRACSIYLKTPFENTADAASILTTAVVGYTGTTNGFITSTELNKNGTFVTQAKGPSTAVAPFTAATAILLTIAAPTTGKKLSDINKGELHIYFKLLRVAKLAGARSSETILTK